MARFLLDDEPEEVFAMAGGPINPAMAELGDHDTAMILMRTASGTQCQITNSRTAVYGYDQRIELFGDRGMMDSGNCTPHAVRRYSAEAAEVAAPYQFFFAERYREAFEAEIDAFVAAVETGHTTAPGFEDGRRALVLAARKEATRVPTSRPCARPTDGCSGRSR